jgi:hypothetical protein
MNPLPNGLADSPALDEPGYERRDLRCRDIVDHAIAVQESRNTMSAVEYLKSHDIASHVIERVLLEPERRRTISAH